MCSKCAQKATSQTGKGRCTTDVRWGWSSQPCCLGPHTRRGLIDLRPRRVTSRPLELADWLLSQVHSLNKLVTQKFRRPKLATFTWQVHWLLRVQLCIVAN
uniref:Tnp_DDE_dom domain-containing protein n=1 Tax=Mesocestoides corti TaxID=53468 RepID=A0A5K3F863_MESCO